MMRYVNFVYVILFALLLPTNSFSQIKSGSLDKLIRSADSLYYYEPLTALKILSEVDSINSIDLDSNVAALNCITRAKFFINANLAIEAQLELAKAEKYFNVNTPNLTFYKFYVTRVQTLDYDMIGNHAFADYTKCLYYAEKDNNDTAIISALLNLADLSGIIGSSKSLQYIDSAYAIALKSNCSQCVARVKATYALYYVRAKDYIKAKAYVDELDALVLPDRFKVEDIYNLHMIKAIVLGHINLLESNKILDSIEALCRDKHFIFKLPQVYGLKTINYKELGDFQNAFLWSEKYIELKDSISKSKTAKTREILNFNRELERKSLELEKAHSELRHYINYAVIVSIAVIIFLIIISKYLINKRAFSLQNKINKLRINNQELKSESIRNQMKPHFILNALNSLQNLIFEKDLFKVSQSISNLGKLTSIYLEDNFNEFISISDEIEQLKIYFEVEKLRIGDKAVLNFFIDNSINPHAQCIPTMILQPLIENAIWHGVVPSKSQCQIEISFLSVNMGLLMIVSDTGVGLNYTNEFSSRKRSSKGLKLIKNRLSILNQLYSTNIRFSLVNNDDDKGARAEIFIPDSICKPQGVGIDQKLIANG